MLGKHSTTEPHPQPSPLVFKIKLKMIKEGIFCTCPTQSQQIPTSFIKIFQKISRITVKTVYSQLSVFLSATPNKGLGYSKTDWNEG
jgi:hypothetical protein